MPPTLQYLEVPERAALLVRMAVASAFRDGSLPGGDPRCLDVQTQRVVAPLLLLSNQIRTTGQDEVDRDLEGVLTQLAGLRLESPDAAMGLVRARVHSVKTRIEALIAGAEHRREIPAVLADLFEALSDHVWGRYAAACPWYGTRPLTYLEMGWTHEHNTTDALDETALLGSCRAEDGERPTSIVQLGVRDNGFDWYSSCQLPYVLVHELLCHAYQGLARAPFEPEGTPGTPRRMTDPSCAWSEGWMDAVALWTAERWVGTAPPALRWASVTSSDARPLASVLHQRRCEPQAGLSPHKLGRRRAARTAAGLMREECLLFGTAGEALMEGFSLCLNALPIPQAERDRLVDDIGLCLETAVDDERDHMMEALLALPRTGDWRGMGAYLRRILGTS